jgi:endo-1,4-beta-D-glucanase Y
MIRLRWIGFILVALAVFTLGVVLYQNSQKRNISITYAANTLLNSTWLNYKKIYLEPTDFRTLDPSRADITTSEGESYTMLRAAWLGDQTTFDEQDTWIKDNLQHSTDHLFAWEFGKRADGSYGILTADGGNTAASDADTDIAVSLVLAYSRWQNPQYLDDARDIMRDIWAHEVVTINGTPYLAADNLEKAGTNSTILVNPSYFAPYAYRIFAEVDPGDGWSALIDSSYAVTKQSMALTLDASSSAGLPPDWIAINRKTGVITSEPTAITSSSSSAPSSSSLSTNFGYDAMRVPFRLALDYQWYKDPRDKELLDQMSFLSTTYNAAGRLDATYTHAGTIAANYNYESAAMYGGTIGYFMVSDPTLATTVYNDKLLFLYDADTNTWKQILSYYDDNWAWFGIALYNHLLPNLTTSVPQSVLVSQ